MMKEALILINGFWHTQTEVNENPFLKQRDIQIDRAIESGFKNADEGIIPESIEAINIAEKIEDTELREYYIQALKDRFNDKILEQKRF